MEDDIQDLLIKTTCAGALGIAGAELVRIGFHRILLERYFSGKSMFSMIQKNQPLKYFFSLTDLVCGDTIG